MKTTILCLALLLQAGILSAKISISDSVKVEKTPSWETSASLGLSLSHTLNLNPPASAPKQGFSTTDALDLTANYIKENSRLKAQNELHWTFSFFKARASLPTQNTADQVQTLHDFSYSFKKKKAWNINLIAKSESQFFTLYDNNYLKDFTNMGPIQRFLNPYRYTLSPGIKYQPNKFLGISISPYSVDFFGLTDRAIADKGTFIDEKDANNKYKSRIKNVLGAEANIWFTKKIKKRAELTYRLNVSSNYFENILKNGKIGGTFITKVNLVKNLSLTHRAILKGDLAQKPFKPFYNQVILLAYSVAF